MISTCCMVNNILDEKKRLVKSLEKLCMICCQKIVKSKGYINPKNVSSNSEVLKELFSISVNKESEEVNFTFTEDLIFINFIKKCNNVEFIFSYVYYNYCNHI